MDHKGGAVDRLHRLLVQVEVKAAEETGGTATTVGIWVDHLDPGEQRRVHNHPAQVLSRCKAQGRSAADALPISHDLLREDTRSDQIVVGGLEVRNSVLRAGQTGGHAVAAVLDAHHFYPAILRELRIWAHHHADVRGIAVGMQKHQWPLRRLIRAATVGRRASGRRGAAMPEPDHGHMLPTACPQQSDVGLGRCLYIGLKARESL
mmetsp:Transcript_40280/g.85918  ORF Transcript_40280/g.85918 Transcript_40280/m.85918 type:complete len:206 (+) Transcript_40280:426-1043(+)